ncbi:hypothetical protein [Azospirillum sp. TSO22-1]|uniref:hypothetical protein n=1 Tax=Azospirillum sp. TSO22-1 TaxID=716789 RepID=UPI000D6036A4|nr:hypothetical protein [Azospirillum sp. TSO22-1]PWC55803.1 hypothetical protein TSO221_03575 [Azospirillum sp. TSO22-1]
MLRLAPCLTVMFASLSLMIGSAAASDPWGGNGEWVMRNEFGSQIGSIRQKHMGFNDTFVFTDDRGNETILERKSLSSDSFNVRDSKGNVTGSLEPDRDGYVVRNQKGETTTIIERESRGSKRMTVRSPGGGPSGTVEPVR